MRPFVKAVVAGVLVAGGFFAGRTWAARGVSSSLQAQAARLDELRGSVDEVTRALSLLAMTRVIGATPAAPCPEPSRTAAAAQPIEATPAPAPAPVASPPRPEEDASMNSAEGMFADATSRGRWTAEDDDALLQLRNEAPGADWRPFMQKLVASINAGQLRR